MKRKIARIVSKRVAPLLILAYIILLVCSFYAVSYIIRKNELRHTETISGIYADLVNYYAEQDNLPVDENYAEQANFFGDYICKWNGIDYAYMYIPDIEKGTIKYISFSQNDDVRIDIAKTINLGVPVKHLLNKDELAIWKGEKVFANSILEDFDASVFTTEICIEDLFGNKIIAGVGVSYHEILVTILKLFRISALLIFVVFVGIYVVIIKIMKKRVSEPTHNISRTMMEYTKDVAHSSVKLNEDSCLEYEMISNSFNSVSDDISSYLDSIKTLTNEQFRQQSELDVAARIQHGFLPKENIVSDAFYIQCMMKPAYNVGGDFYDCIQLDENRTMLVIADVSGKGITAAIFMAITLVLIREYSKTNISPARILEKANNTISSQNQDLLFVTIIVGIFDKRDNSFTYSNAGHNMPFLISDKLYELENISGTPIGLFANETYTEHSIKLNTGDTIFMFTDGVNEIINENNEFFGIERLKSLLQQYVGKDVSFLVNEVYKAIKTFSGKQDQFDDITMLSLTCRDSVTLELDYSIDEFERIKELILKLPINRKEQLSLCLAAEEMFVNICNYAFPEGIPEGEKIIFTLSQSDVIILRFEDSGVPFDPTKDLTADIDYDPDTQIGGLGKSLTANIMDHFFYTYENNKNILTLTKRYKETNS